MQAVHFGFRIVEVPARTRYFPEASSASFGQSGSSMGFKTLWGRCPAGCFNRAHLIRSRKFLALGPRMCGRPQRNDRAAFRSR